LVLGVLIAFPTFKVTFGVQGGSETW